MTIGRGLPPGGLRGDEEHCQAHAGQCRSAPGDQGNCLTEPELAQDQHEDQFRGQQRLHNRECAVVQRQRLEHERCHLGRRAEKPQPVVQHVHDQAPARCPSRRFGARDVLGGLVDRVRERCEQREDEDH